jgi:hypothetical protein
VEIPPVIPMAGMQIAIKRPLRRLCQPQNTRKIVMHSSVEAH